MQRNGCVCMHKLYIYLILLSKSNLFKVTGLTFLSEIMGKSKHRLFDKHNKQCHGQTKKGQAFFLLKMHQEEINSFL